MTASLAYNPKTGEALRLNADGQWEPTRVAKNPNTGEVLALDGEMWAKVADASQPQRSGMERTMRGFGLGARNLIEGVTALPGMISDNILRAASLTGAVDAPKKPAGEVLADTLGLPKPESRAERVVGRGLTEVAAALPTMGAGLLMRGAQGVAGGVGNVLASNMGSQVAGAGAGGVSAQLAREAGAGPLTEAAAGIFGGVAGAGTTQGLAAAGRTMGAVAQPFTQSGRERMAADALLMASSDPESLPARIRAGVVDDGSLRIPGAPVTTATAARDPGLAVLEQGARSDVMRAPGQGGVPAGIAIRDIEARRNALRLGEATSLNPTPNVSPEGRGAAIRGTLQNALNEARAQVRQLYGNIERGGEAQIDGYPLAMSAAESARRAPGQAALPAELTSILDDVADNAAARPLTIEFLQNIRSRLGEVIGKAGKAGEDELAATATRVRETLMAGLADAIANGQGVTADQARNWTAATAARRQMGEAFNRSQEGGSAVGRVLNRDQFGANMMPDSAVAPAVISSPENVRQALRAAGMNARPVRDQLRGQFIDDMVAKMTSGGASLDAQGNAVANLSGANFIKYLRDNDSVARMLFDGSQYQRLQRIGRDFAETMSAQGSARARGSDTAQNLSVGNLIARATNGLIDPGNPLAQTVAGFGPILKAIYSAPEAATREILSRAIVDPNFAMTLVSRATPRNVQRAADYLNRTMPERLAGAVQGAVARQGARTGNALAVQQSQEQRQ